MEIHQSYIIQEVIGRTTNFYLDGASCTVRKAIRRDDPNKTPYAIKIYQNEMLKAKNQIDLLIRLDHPSIVNIYEIFEQDNTIILVLEFMAGGQLYQQVGQRSTFTQAQVRKYMITLIDATRYCHEMEIVHRDIKPQNLLLTTNGPDGTLKLADFGISKILSDEMLTTNCGTPVYMAPEIWMGKAYNQKADMWSIGVVILSGTHPFNGESQDLGKEIMDAELTFPEHIWGSISSKVPSQRSAAKDIEGHIWLSHVQPIPRQVSEVQEVNLYRTVHKIKRFIYKDKLKKTYKKMKDLMNAQNLSKARMEFLIYETQDTQLESQITQIQIESLGQQEVQEV